MENAQSHSKTLENRKIIMNEIHGKWGKFSDQELSGLKGKDDLVSQVQSKYGVERVQAQKEVDTLLKGRAF